MPRPTALFACLLALGACARPPAPKPLELRPAWAALGEAPASGFGVRAMAAGDVNGDGFGDLLVGAPNWEGQRGKAYLYYGSTKGLAAKAAWTAVGEPGERFGDRVGQAGDLNGDGFDDIFVASPGWKHGLGRCVVYNGSKRGLRAEPAWQTQSALPGEEFGDCTHPTGDLNGDGFDDLAVGAYGHDQSRGRLLLFNGGRQGLSATPFWQARGEALHDWYGYGVGAAGDVNGDGFDDLLAGAKYNDQGGHDAGKAYLYAGAAQGLNAGAAWAWRGPGAESNATVRIATAGDLNADGYADVLVTAPGTKGDGRCFYLFFGSAQGLAGQPSQRIEAPEPGLEFFGQGAAPAGDLDGDGYDDLAIHGRGPRGQGRVFVYRGGPAGLSAAPRWLLPGNGMGDRFGWWLAPAGDVDGDGLADLVVSAESTEQGSVSVYLGKDFKASASPPAASQARKLRLNGYLASKK